MSYVGVALVISSKTITASLFPAARVAKVGFCTGLFIRLVIFSAANPGFWCPAGTSFSTLQRSGKLSSLGVFSYQRRMGTQTFFTITPFFPTTHFKDWAYSAAPMAPNNCGYDGRSTSQFPSSRSISTRYGLLATTPPVRTTLPSNLAIAVTRFNIE